MDEVSPSAALSAIIQWYERVKAASMELPQGWFGRPHDTWLHLTWSAATTHKLLLEFNASVLLVITDPGPIAVLDAELRIGACRQVTLDPQEYGEEITSHAASARVLRAWHSTPCRRQLPIAHCPMRSL